MISSTSVSRHKIQRRREDFWLLAAAFVMTFVVTLVASITMA